MSDAFVAVLVIELRLPDARSLKAKRKDVQSVKAQLRGRLGVAVSETADHDRWQRATLTAALTAGALGALEHRVDELERWLEARFPQGVRVERLISSLEDLRG